MTTEGKVWEGGGGGVDDSGGAQFIASMVGGRGVEVGEGESGGA